MSRVNNALAMSMMSSASDDSGIPDHLIDEPTKRILDEDAITVRWTRLFVALVLLVSAAIVGALAYLVVYGQEKDDFHNHFEASSLEVIKASSDKAIGLAYVTDNVGDVITSFATESKSVLPFFTLEDFGMFGQSVLEITGASLITYAPYLPNEAFRLAWEDHAADHVDWIYQSHTLDPNFKGNKSQYETIPPKVWCYDNVTHQPVTDMYGGPYMPLWETFPPPDNTSILELNLYRYTGYQAMIDHIRVTSQNSLSPPYPVSEWFHIPADFGPEAVLMHPVYSSFEETRAYFAGAVTTVLPFTVFFTDLLREGIEGVLVMVNSCGTNHTYIINGPAVEFVGYGDLHDAQYDHMVKTGPLEYIDHEHIDTVEFCQHELFIYPTVTFEETYYSNDPILYSMTVVAMFVFAMMVFIVYDLVVQFRQRKTDRDAQRTDEIVQQLFPDQFREKLFDDPNDNDNNNHLNKTTEHSHKFLSDGANRNMEDRPIAEFFPEATVFFADIAGFTAWSSIREPSHVFKLLETIFRAFDDIAKRYGVFKVETVGDCYVAVVGVPQPVQNHALTMVKFARECIERFAHVVRGLELSLGPDTSDLAIRIGIHSGPVTAGVLRGDRARFQLFGETVNIASRTESSGSRDRIHITEVTAHLVVTAGKSEWLAPRDDQEATKAKLGTIKTFWVKTKRESRAPTSHTASSSQEHDDEGEAAEHGDEKKDQANDISNISLSTKASTKRSISSSARNAIQARRQQRLVDWNVELLAQLLRQVMARRVVLGRKRTSPDVLDSMASKMGSSDMVVNEVAEIISLPHFDAKAHAKEIPPVQLSEQVMSQLRGYVAAVASMYHDNPFHNFEHASHVTMSVSKLLSRIVAPTNLKNHSAAGEEDVRNMQERMHDHTYGITSDPLTQFAVVLSALIHDVDHRGVPNFILAKEDKALARCYKGKCLAEQNSVDLSWSALMSDGYEELRQCIYADATELKRFRQLLVNSVIATDIFDKELGQLRRNRWNKAFHDLHEQEEAAAASASVVQEDPRTHIDRKATIVIEHLIQASDVAHTMQHWHVYQKWNERLFSEMYTSFQTGRSDNDPSINWYKGELAFFDNYIIPLAKNLKECGVFGVSSDEYLNYAMENRKEWAERGEEIVLKFLESCAHENLISV